MRKRKIIKGIICCFIVIIMLSLTACRPSPALQKVIYDNNQTNVSKEDNLEMVNNTDKSKKVEEDLSPSKKSQNSNNIRDRKADIPDSSDENETKDKLKQKKPDEDTSSNGANETNDNIDKDETNQVNKTNQNNKGNMDSQINNNTSTKKEYKKEDSKTSNNTDSSNNNSNTNSNTNSKTNSKTNNDNGEDEGNNEQTQVKEGAMSTKEIIDATGVKVKVVTDVNSIAAVGEAANMVCMLGGANRLIATSESFSNNSLLGKIYQKELNNNINTLWPYDGKSTISDENFTKLLKLKPQVCIETSGDATLSEKQIRKLKDTKIAYVVLYKMNTSSNIKDNARILGEVLGKSGSVNAKSLASKYSKYYDSVISDLNHKVDRVTNGLIDYDNDRNINGVKKLTSNKNDSTSSSFNGKYSVFIDRWDDEAGYSITTSQKVYLKGKGVAVTQSGYSASPLSYYMSIAGVLNVPAMYADFGQTQNWYVNPLIPSTKTLSVEGNYVYQKEYYLTLTNNDKSSNTTARTNGLGNPDTFPAIIVANQTIKKNIKNDVAWATYDYIKATNGLGENYGFLDEEGGIIESSIIGDYEIYVNPSGVGSWTDGGVESILEPIWIASKFYNAYSESEVKKMVKEFYKTFYRYSLSDSEVESILAGEK